MTVSTFKLSNDVNIDVVYFFFFSRLILIRLIDTQTAQSLHPGGKYYPQVTGEQQMSTPTSHNSDVRIAVDDHSEFGKAG